MWFLSNGSFFIFIFCVPTSGADNDERHALLGRELLQPVLSLDLLQQHGLERLRRKGALSGESERGRGEEVKA